MILKKTILVQYLCIGIIVFSLATSTMGTTIAIAESQEDWNNFSITSYKDSIRIFKSNDTYSRQLFVKLNIINISNGELSFSYQKGDTIPSKTFNSTGLYEFSVTTEFAQLRTNAENTSIIGSYNLVIGKKVSESPWLTVSAVFILGLFMTASLSRLGIPLLLSLILSLIILVGSFIISVLIVRMGYKSWKEKKTNSKLIIFGVELAVFLIITGILLIPMRFSFF